MRKVICLILAGVLILGLVGCGADSVQRSKSTEEPATSAQSQKQTDTKTLSDETLGEISYKVQSEWRRADAENGYYYYPTEESADGFLYITCQSLDVLTENLSDTEISLFFESYVQGMETGDNALDVSSKEYGKEVCGYPSAQISATMMIGDTKYSFLSSAFVTTGSFYSIAIVEPEDATSGFLDELDSIVETVSVTDQTGKDEDLEEIAKKLGYAFISDAEIDGVIHYSGAEPLESGDLLDLANGVSDDSQVWIMHELDGENDFEETGKSLTIYLNIETASELVDGAELLFKEGGVREFERITISPMLGNVFGIISIIWDADNERYVSDCTDLSEDKSLDPIYGESELFSKIDMMARLDSDLDDIAKKYGLSE